MERATRERLGRREEDESMNDLARRTACSCIATGISADGKRILRLTAIAAGFTSSGEGWYFITCFSFHSPAVFSIGEGIETKLKWNFGQKIRENFERKGVVWYCIERERVSRSNNSLTGCTIVKGCMKEYYYSYKWIWYFLFN